MLHLILIAIAVLLVLLLALCYYLTFPPGTKELQHLNGPPADWVFGIALQLPNELHDLTNLALTWWGQYKSPAKAKFLHRYVVHLWRAEHVELLMKDTDNITKSHEYNMLAPWLGEGLLISTGDKWRHRRKLLTPTFHFQILKDFMQIFNEQSEILLEVLAQSSSTAGAAIDIAPPLVRCTLDVICETAMGIKLDSQRNLDCEYANVVDRAADLFLHRAYRPWLWSPWVYKLTANGREYKQKIEQMQNLSKTVIAEREQELLAGSEGNPNGSKSSKSKVFLDLLLEMKRDGLITMEGVREEVDTFMLEGHGTTATGLMWALYCIGLHAQIQEQLYEEVLGACGAEGPVTTAHLPGLKLLERVFKESVRLYPPIPMVARTLSQDLEVAGTRIPKGTDVHVPVIGMHRNPEEFPDPLKFDPDRFLPDQIEKRHPFAFLPFAAGPRNCIEKNFQGQKFAMMEAKVVLAHVIRAFRFESVQDPSTIRMSMALLLRPRDGIWLKITSRS